MKNSNINLSFFFSWQEGIFGRENAPDAQDSLKLSFKNAEGNWVVSSWDLGGSGNIERTLFFATYERVNDTSFLHAGFQF